MSKPTDIAYRYLAKNGEELAGVPTADITYEMLAAMTPLALRDLNHSPLYESTEVAPPPDKTPAKGEKE